jgi:hypothetical protein
MNKTIAAAIFAALTLPATAFAESDISKTLDLTDFSQIEIAGVFELEVSVGGDYRIELSGPESEMARVTASVKGDTLVLNTRDRKRGERKKRDRDAVKAVVSLPSLTGIDVSGVVEASADGIDAEVFSADLSGVGEVTLSGACGRFDADVSGVGELDAKGFECRDVDVDVSGVGEATVYASGSVDARVSGIGEINVYGSPKSVSKKGGLFSEITVH